MAFYADDVRKLMKKKEAIEDEIKELMNVLESVESKTFLLQHNDFNYLSEIVQRSLLW